MTELAGVVQPRAVVPGQVVVDDHVAISTVIDPMSAAVHGVVRVLGELVHRSNSFHSESELEEAMNSLRAWEKAQVKQSVLASLLEMSPGRAPYEDVTKRVPPQIGQAVAAAIPAQIDYAKLAAAIVQAQAALASQGPEDA